MLKVYGRANSINVRKVLWMLEEVGRKIRARGLGPRLPAHGRSRVSQDQSGRRRARDRRRRFPAARKQHHRALSGRQARPRRPLSRRTSRRAPRIESLDGLGLDRLRQRHAAGVPRPYRQEPGVRRQGRSRRARNGPGRCRCSSTISPPSGPYVMGSELHDRRYSRRPGRQPLVLDPLPEARVQGRLGLLRQARATSALSRRMAATAHLEREPRSRNCRILRASCSFGRKGCVASRTHQMPAGSAWRILVPCARCVGAVQQAQEYCVACTGPVRSLPLHHRRRAAGRQPAPADALHHRHGQGRPHATCSVKGGTVFDCNGPVKRVPWAAYNEPGRRRRRRKRPSRQPLQRRLRQAIPISHRERWKRWPSGRTRKPPSRSKEPTRT